MDNHICANQFHGLKLLLTLFHLFSLSYQVVVKFLSSKNQDSI